MFQIRRPATANVLSSSSSPHCRLFSSFAVSTTDRQISRLVALCHAVERPIFSGFKSGSIACMAWSSFRPLPVQGRLWPVPNYTAWWQRHMCVNNLPRVVTWKWNSQELNPRPLDRESNALNITPACHTYPAWIQLSRSRQTVRRCLDGPDHRDTLSVDRSPSTAERRRVSEWTQCSVPSRACCPVLTTHSLSEQSHLHTHFQQNTHSTLSHCSGSLYLLLKL